MVRAHGTALTSHQEVCRLHTTLLTPLHLVHIYSSRRVGFPLGFYYSPVSVAMMTKSAGKKETTPQFPRVALIKREKNIIKRNNKIKCERSINIKCAGVGSGAAAGAVSWDITVVCPSSSRRLPISRKEEKLFKLSSWEISFKEMTTKPRSCAPPAGRPTVWFLIRRVTQP